MSAQYYSTLIRLDTICREALPAATPSTALPRPELIWLRPVIFSDDFASLFDLLPTGVYRSSPGGQYLRANRALVALTGHPSEQALLASIANLATDWYVDAGRRAQFVALMLEHGAVTDFVSEIYSQNHADQSHQSLWISENAHVVRNGAGEVQFFEGTVENITARHNAEQQLADSERRHRALMKKAQVATAIVDERGSVLFATGATHALFGCELELFVGQNIFDSLHLHDSAEYRAEFVRVAQHKNTGRESVARHQQPDGSFRYLASVATDGRDDPAINGIVLNWRDVTDATLAQARLRVLAETDALTGLANRLQFETRSTELIDQAAVTGQQLALYFVDLNRFKIVNDSHGHIIGDQVLKMVAARLREHVGDAGVLARIGGDEFGLICAIEGRAQAIERGQTLINAMTASIQLDQLHFELGVSVGVSLFPDDGAAFAELLSRANLAMFEAKAQRAGTAVAFKIALASRAHAQLVVATELRQAIQAGEICPFYQPIVVFGSGEWRGLEALARWRHPKRGLLLPDEFIPAAEEQGLIGEIGRVIAQSAVAQLAKWRSQFACTLRLTINVSAQELRSIDYVPRMLALIAEHKLPKRAVALEVTESSMMVTEPYVRERFAALREGGVMIALDDLGIGYSTLEYFKRFPVDFVKIDKLFMQGVPTRRVDAAIVRSIGTLAAELGLWLIAEGIERPEQAQFAQEAGCHFGQGYLYAAPKSAAEIQALFETGTIRLPAIPPDSREQGSLD